MIDVREISACLNRYWIQGFTLVLVLLGGHSFAADFQGATHLLDFEREPIRYSKASSQTKVDDVEGQLREGRLSLAFHETDGYLRDLLKTLDIAPASQVLVFAKSSAQRDFIDPLNPRAIYFNDEVYLGYIPGAPLLELTASDPQLGTVFYTLEQKRVAKPTFERNSQCLECHAASRTLGIPGHLFRSFATDRSGLVDFTELGAQITDRLPLEKRYGAWYVSNDVSRQGHLGRSLQLGETPPFHSSRYLSEGSDLVALLVLGHQVHFHNFLTRLSFGARLAMEQYGHVRYMKAQIDAFLRYVMFLDEAPLARPQNPDSPFAKSFVKRADKDTQGRSLRDFDLKERLFKYRCSYLIGADAFQGLEPVVHQEISLRLKEILEAEVPEAPFDVVPFSERIAILAILQETENTITRFW